MHSAPVLAEKRGKALVLTLNRAESGNAIDEAMAMALRDACRQAIEDDDCAVVLLIATGNAFCLGAAPMSDPLAEIPSRRLADAVAAIPKPVIAAIQGDAIGVALFLALDR